MSLARVKDFFVGKNQPLTLIAGPCVIENEKMAMQTAEALKKTMDSLSAQFIFKASYKKANRTSLEAFRGIGFSAALKILEKVRNTFDVPVLSDIHSGLDAPVVADVADVLQIPAFLCRQTDLLLAAGRTGKTVNIKKGQFLAPEAMQKAAEKVSSTGNQNILLTERGTTFGYENLVVDMRGLSIMAKSGYPVVFDATHSVQIPGGKSRFSGGRPEFILPLARAAIATGAISAIFMEVHPDPENALSDAQSQLPLSLFSKVAGQLTTLYDFISEKVVN